MTPDIERHWLRDRPAMIMTMRSEDASRWNPQELVDFAKSFSVGALGFSVGGISAFYPTDVPDHPVCAGLDGRDLVGETIAALQSEGIRAIGRIDPSLGSPEALAKYPERFARSADGQPLRMHDYYLTCPNGPHYREFMLDVVREIVTRYPLDGLWANAAQFSPWSAPRCHCEACQNHFGDLTGAHLPEEDWADPLWKQYNEMRYERIADWNRLVREVITEIRPGCAWLPLSQVVESWDHIRKGGWDVDYSSRHADGIVLEAQRRYCNLWWPGMESRYANALSGGTGAGVTVSYFYPWWRFTHAPVAENRVWAAQIAANGAQPWLHVTGFYSEVFDRRGLDPMRELFNLFDKRQDIYGARTSAAEVALVFSRHTQDYVGGGEPDRYYLDGFRGAYNALMEANIPFDLLSDKTIAGADLGRYKALLLPNQACMDDDSAAALTRYMEAGGTIVATGKTGFCDLFGVRRANPVVADWLGATQTDSFSDLKASYAVIDRRDEKMLAGIGDTDLLPVAGDVFAFDAGDADDGDMMHLVPPVEAYPGSGMSVPEFNSAARIPHVPMVLSRGIGQGRCVYFPWEPDRIGFTFGLNDTMRLLTNALDTGARPLDLLRISAPGLIDVSVMDGPGRRVLHLVNFNTGGGVRSANRRAVEHIVPLHGVEVDLKLPPDTRCTEIEAIVAGEKLAFQQANGRVTFILPHLTEFESLKIALAAEPAC